MFLKYVFIFLAISCYSQWSLCFGQEKTTAIKIAFLADVHLQDIYATYSDTEYKGIINPKNDMYTTIRTMQSQLNSTRIFNENYFAFLAALDDIVARGIHYVVMPGDFSDDGQAVNISALNTILHQYQKQHGISFILTTGNHDPVRPYTIPAGKKDFLGEGGKQQAILSPMTLQKTKKVFSMPVVVTKDIRKLGYKDILNSLSSFGFFPKKDDVYWATPFSEYNYKEYDYDRAIHEAVLEKRMYPVGSQNCMIPDASYVVESIPNIWFLAIDANVYPVKEGVTIDNQQDGSKYRGASIGYNEVLVHKKHLINWIQKVVVEAKQLNKILIPFSHYPMIDFNNGATKDISTVFGKKAMQLHRVPNEDVANIFADIGLQIHFGGHMHSNDTGKRITKAGNTLINIQIPTISAYPPAYKVLTINNKSLFEIETIVLNEVPNFDDFFDLYHIEHQYLQDQTSPLLWDKSILKSKNYKEFTHKHLEELIQHRFLKQWPEELKKALMSLTGKELLYALQQKEIVAFKRILDNQGVAADMVKETNIVLKKKKLQLLDFEDWNGSDVILDFYKLKQADELALSAIDKKRLRHYEVMYELASTKPVSELQKQLITLFRCIYKFANGEPSDHFLINLDTNSVHQLHKK